MDEVPSHPSTPGRVFIGINALFIVLVSFLVGLRFWARRLKGTFFGWDDWCILIALVIYYGQAALNFWVVYHGALGYHVDQAGKLGLRNLFLQLTISQFIYAVQFFMIRLSICFLLMRIFIQPWLRKTVSIAMGINVAWALFVIITALAVCRPFAYNWDLTIRGGHCDSQVKLNTYIANAVWTIVYDAFLWSLPQFIVWRLQMRLAAKVAISVFFALGIFDIIVSIIRITYVVNVDLKDATFGDYHAQIWTVVEVSVAIIVACLPLCRVVVEHVLPIRFMSSIRKHPHTRTASWTNLGAPVDVEQNAPLKEDKAAEKLNPLARNPFDEELDAIELQFPAQARPKGMDKIPEITADEKATMERSRIEPSFHRRGPSTEIL